MSDRIERLEAWAYEVPAQGPESDGTLEWTSTTLVVVELESGAERGLGYTYAAPAAARVASDTLRDVVVGRDPMAIPAAHAALRASVRNQGPGGLAAMAVSAVDVALWDLKAKLLGLPLVDLLGEVRTRVPIYGSGGFTSQSIDELRRQLGGWVAAGIPRVKMKVGRRPDRDPARVRAAREAIGPDAELYVDANGACGVEQALRMGAEFVAAGVTWFEEPVPPEDVAGLRFLRERLPPGLAVAAGEYGYGQGDFRRILDAGCVDVLQPDATRCGGVTGFLAAAVLAGAHGIPISAHGAPNLHAHLGCAVPGLRHLEYFHDHARIEGLLFEGALEVEGGTLRPDRSRPGLGLALRRDRAEPYLAGGVATEAATR